MVKILQRTTAGMVLLLMMPLAVWLSGWQWQPEESYTFLRVLFWMTETVTRPWGHTDQPGVKCLGIMVSSLSA